MHLRGLDLNLLVAFDALLAERNVTRAGQRLNLSQSATSAALGRLRQFFGDELLVSAGSRMILTPKALELKDQVREFVLKAEGLTLQQSVFSAATATREFHLMMSDYTAAMLMPVALRDIQREAPGVSFRIDAFPGQPDVPLDQGDVDLLIMPQQWTSQRHPVEEVFVDQYVCVVCSRSRLAKGLVVDQYLAARHVAVQFPGQPYPVLEEWLFEQLGKKRLIDVVVPSFSLAPRFVVGTERIATMHAWLARDCARFLPIAILPSPFEIPQIVQCMQWNRHRTEDPGIRWLRQRLKDAAIHASTAYPHNS